MALKIFPASGHLRTRYSALAALAVLLTATAAQAGFEWVPSPKKSAAPIAAPDNAAKQVPAPPSVDVLLPETPPSAVPPLPVESQPLPAATQNIQPAPTAAPQQSTIKVKEFGTNANAAPAQKQTPEASPPVNTQRMILSDDAPETARIHAQDRQSPSPQPSSPATEQPQPRPPVADVEPQQIAPVELQKVEGFGTDIPLALALREIVPANYAYSFGDGVNPGYRVSWTGGKDWLEVVREMIAPLGLSASVQGNIVVIRNTNSPARIAPEAGDKRSEIAPPQAEQNKTTIYSLRRQAITNPGEASASQPPETLEMIEEVVSSEMPEAVPAPKAGTQKLAAQAETSPAGQNAGNQIFWEARKGDSLKRTLDSWSKKANIQLVWESSHDYSINTDILMNGDFQRALSMAAISSAEGENAPKFIFVDAKNPGEPGKLIVQDSPAKS